MRCYYEERLRMLGGGQCVYKCLPPPFVYSTSIPAYCEWESEMNHVRVSLCIIIP